MEPKVRATVESLPFTTEGYERAKNILKTKYGKESEIVNAHVTNIMSLPVIYGSNPNKILEFYEMLSPNLQALKTMGKIEEVNRYVRMTLDKLEGIKGELVRTDDSWQDWEFPHLLEALRKWTTRNPPQPADERHGNEKTFPFKPLKMKSYHVRQHDQRRRPCVYCESSKHQSVNCDKDTTIHERRKQLNLKQLCFNGTSTKPQGFKMPLFFNLQVLHQGIVLRVHSEQQGKAFYIPQKAIVQETAESTKI